MDRCLCLVFSSNGRRTLRQAAAFYLLAFLLAVSAAPHHHLNPLADLLSDGPSDSGVILQIEGTVGSRGGPQLNPVRLIDDEPCPACFHHDFATLTGHLFEHIETLKPSEETRLRRNPAPPRAFREAPASRSPPVVA